MPLPFHRHSNRSRQALNDPAVGTGTPSSGSASSVGEEKREDREREARTNPPQSFIQQSRTDNQSYTAQTIAPDHDPRNQQQRSGDTPTRSQSTRYTPSAYQQQSLHAQAAGASADDLGVESRRYQTPQSSQTLQPIAPEPKKSKSIFDRMRSSSNRNSEPKSPPSSSSQSYNNTSGLSRRLSKKEQTPVVRTAVGNSQLEQPRGDWQAAQDTRIHLPSPLEGNEDDGGLDPYLIRDSEQGSLHSALKEASYQQQTIRPVQSDLEPVDYSTNEERQRFEAEQQHLREKLQQQQVDIGSHNYYQAHLQNQLQQPQVNISSASLVTSDPYRLQNPETVSQLSYESPIEQREEQQRPVSVQSNNGQSPIAGYSAPQRQEYPSRTTSIPQASRPLSQFGDRMAPPSTGSSNRRSADPKQTLQGAQVQGQGQGQGQGQTEQRDASPNYSRGQFPNNQPPAPAMNPVPPPPPGAPPPGPNYRGGPPQREYSGVGGGEQGRSTPPPVSGDRDVQELYKELSAKYKKVKGLYFDKTAQVEQLQNTLANQRLSQSRTSLDDSEYMTRFQRLEGAITNLAFNIRKDWRTVPVWLSQYVNQDAMKIGKQEMTAVGRACITKFLVDEVFTRTFHPGLDADLSANLKIIEQNIRRFSPALNNQEESEALTAKVVQWRLATLEGLKDVLMSPESDEHKKQFSRVATTNLTASLISFLADPPPPGIEDSAHMIIELAVGIASNIPLESRDISIVYPMPGDMFQPSVMKTENPIPALENPGAETGSEMDAASTNSGEKDDVTKEAEKDPKSRKEKTKSGMLQAMMGGSSSSSKKPAPVVDAVEPKKVPIEDGPQRVRLAGFLSVEVRGRQILQKAPVWTC